MWEIVGLGHFQTHRNHIGKRFQLIDLIYIPNCEERTHTIESAV
jgi:hypothetical protein